MKLVIDIDDELITEVKDITCAANEEEAITRSLQSMTTRHWAKKYWSRGPHPTPEDLRNAYSPDYDPRKLAYSEATLG